MIIGEFDWRGWKIEADRIMTPLVGEIIWLNRTGAAPTGLGVVRNGRLELTSFAPGDDLASLELWLAFHDFRTGTTT
jgi:hypothetical protein